MKTPILKACPADKHIIHLSKNWAEAIDSGLADSSSDIATLVGLTSGRVRQILWLSKLEFQIINFLLNLNGKKHLGGFSEKRIRPILELSGEEQIEAFESKFGIKLLP